MNRLVLGLMRGDEGKGKITDYLAKDADVVIRYAGGPNAGHSIYRNNKLFVTHLIPSGIFSKKICVIGRGCVVNLSKLYQEYLDLCMFLRETGDKTFKNPEIEIKELLKLSMGAHVITSDHIDQDTKRENAGKGNGSTKQGISPAYRDKYYRVNMRIVDVIKYWEETNFYPLNLNAYNFFKDIIIDEEEFINKNPNLNILFEGAQGVLLDINSPYYPNVSSSSVGVDGVISGTGINYNNLIKNFEVVGVVKAYMSSVGVGEFLTQLDGNDDNIAKLIRDAGNEYGATTGRPRKVGWFDIPLLKYSIRTSGTNSLCITRLDTLMDAFKDIGKFKVCTSYRNKKSGESVSEANIWFLNEYEPVYTEFDIWKSCSFDDDNFMKFLNYVKDNIQIPISYISIGKNKDDIIEL